MIRTQRYGKLADVTKISVQEFQLVRTNGSKNLAEQYASQVQEIYQSQPPLETQLPLPPLPKKWLHQDIEYKLFNAELSQAYRPGSPILAALEAEDNSYSDIEVLGGRDTDSSSSADQQ